MPRCTFHGEVDPYVWTWEVGSFTNTKTSYTVVIDMGTGETRCSCLDACTRRKGLRRIEKPWTDLLGACKHGLFVLRQARKLLRERE